MHTTPDGTVYECEYMSGAIINGFGSCAMRDGSVYTGEWKQGKREGKGRLSSGDEVVFEGEWLQDSPVYASV